MKTIKDNIYIDKYLPFSTIFKEKNGKIIVTDLYKKRRLASQQMTNLAITKSFFKLNTNGDNND